MLYAWSKGGGNNDVIPTDSIGGLPVCVLSYIFAWHRGSVSGRGLDCYTVSFTATWPGSAKIYSAQRYETVNGLAVVRKKLIRFEYWNKKRMKQNLRNISDTLVQTEFPNMHFLEKLGRVEVASKPGRLCKLLAAVDRNCTSVTRECSSKYKSAIRLLAIFGTYPWVIKIYGFWLVSKDKTYFYPMILWLCRNMSIWNVS